MFALPFLLKDLLTRFGLRAATLLTSCLWFSVALAGSLFGQGVTSIDDAEEEEKPRETLDPPATLIHSRRTSLLVPPSIRLSSVDQRSLNTNAERTNAPSFPRRMLVEIQSLCRLKTFRLLILAMIFLWSVDETNFLFLTDLLKTSGLSENRSTLLIALTGIGDLFGQLLFG